MARTAGVIYEASSDVELDLAFIVALRKLIERARVALDRDADAMTRQQQGPASDRCQLSASTTRVAWG